MTQLQFTLIQIQPRVDKRRRYLYDLTRMGFIQVRPGKSILLRFKASHIIHGDPLATEAHLKAAVAWVASHNVGLLASAFYEGNLGIFWPFYKQESMCTCTHLKHGTQYILKYVTFFSYVR